MATQTPQPGNGRSELSRSTGTSSNTSLIGTQQERRHQLIHPDATNAGTKIWPRMLLYTSSERPEVAWIESSMQLDVSISISWHTAMNKPYNGQLVYVENYVTNSSQFVMGDLHRSPWHLSARSAKLNIMMLSAQRCSRMIVVICIPGSARKNLQSPQRRLWKCIWLRY